MKENEVEGAATYNLNSKQFPQENNTANLGGVGNNSQLCLLGKPVLKET